MTIKIKLFSAMSSAFEDDRHLLKGLQADVNDFLKDIRDDNVRHISLQMSGDRHTILVEYRESKAGEILSNQAGDSVVHNVN